MLKLVEKVEKEYLNIHIGMSNVRTVLLAQGKCNQAEWTYRPTLELMKLLGKEHPNTLLAMISMGTVLLSQRKYKEAGQSYRPTLGYLLFLVSWLINK